MNLIKRLKDLAAADPMPAELVIRPYEVPAVTDHILASVLADECTRLFVQNQILLGRVRLLNVPIKVAS